MYLVKDLTKLKRYDRNNVCGIKKRYDMLDTCYEAARSANSDNVDITLYRCPVCKYWHYGRSYKNNIHIKKT